MVDVEYLRKRIDQSGLKTRFIADQMGITMQALYQKLENADRSWSYGQAMTIRRLLGLTDKEMDAIFFAD